VYLGTKGGVHKRNT